MIKKSIAFSTLCLGLITTTISCKTRQFNSSESLKSAQDTQTAISPDYENIAAFEQMKNDAPREPNLFYKYMLDNSFSRSEQRLAAFLEDAKNIKGTLNYKDAKKLSNEALNAEFMDDSIIPFAMRNSTCYVRAMWFHMRLKHMGIPDSNIKKVILQGYIAHESVGQNWDYHIVTTAKTTDNKWVVFDREWSDVKVLDIDSWYNRAKQYQIKNTELIAPHFLLSIRPAYQWTLVDDKYNLNAIDSQIKDFANYIFMQDAAVKQEFSQYNEKIN